MNTSAQGHRAPQQHVHHGVEGNTKPHSFFFLEYGRCRSVARSLHEHKQSKATFVQGPNRSRCAGKSQQSKQNTTHNHKTTANPPARFAFRQSKQKTQTKHTTGQGPKQEHPQERICQWTQRSYHCVTLKNMPKLIIHYDIP